jgi:hypothetical protein
LRRFRAVASVVGHRDSSLRRRAALTMRNAGP